MKTIGVYNLKGGVGKTTTSVNLAYLASQEGYRTLLWDLDPQRSATYYFRKKASSRSKASQRTTLDRLIKTTDYLNLDLFPAYFKMRNLDLALGEIKKQRKKLGRLVETLSMRYEMLFLDCPASMSLLSESIFQVVDYLVIPVVPTSLSIHTFKQIRKYLHQRLSQPAHIIPFFSMVDGRKALHRNIMEHFGPRAKFCKALIPSRSVTEQMGIHRQPLPVFSPDSEATKEYRALWDEIKERMQQQDLLAT